MARAAERPPEPERRRQHERSAQSAQRLLDAAIELIAEKGFERTKAGEIGERAGYSREMVRNRYGSKEQLLEVLMETEYKAKLLPADPGSTLGRQRALQPLQLMSTMARSEPDLLRAFFVLSFESVGPVAELLPWMRRFFADYREHVVAALQAGQRDGSVGSDLVVPSEADDIIVRGIGLGFTWSLDPAASSFVVTLESWIAELDQRWAPTG